MVGVRHVEKQSILGYQSGGLESFLQIYMAAPTLVPTAKFVLIGQGGQRGRDECIGVSNAIESAGTC